jgi:hypothetical protein
MDKTKVLEFRETKGVSGINSYEAVVKTANGKKVIEIDLFHVPQGLALNEETYFVNALSSYQRDGGELKRMKFVSVPFSTKIKDSGISDAARRIAEDLAKPTLMDKLLKR